MKTNKLLILALPLLLAISACSNSGGNANQSSQDTSSEEPAPSRSEEPLPEVDPAQQEADAKEALANVNNMLQASDYMVTGDIAEGGYNTPYIVVVDGFYSRTVSPQLDDGTVEEAISVGYLANKNGVLRTRAQWSGNLGNPVGYALKTNNYEEAREYVNSLQQRFTLDSKKWEYVPNETGSANFKTTDEDTLNEVCEYLYGTVIPGKLSVAYAKVAVSGEAVTISTDSSMPGRSNYFFIKKIDLNNNRNRTVTRESDYGDWRVYEIAQLISNWKDRELSETEWSTFEYALIATSELPFPSEGNRYYFYDRYIDNHDKYYHSDLYTHIGFVDTGDISESYKTQLLNNNWSLDAGETNKFTSSYNQRCHVTVRFVAAADCDRPDLYTKGIFYLDFTYVE